VYDLNAGLLDDGFFDSFKGLAGCSNGSSANGGIMPWSNNILAVVSVDNGRGQKIWQKVDYDQRLTVAPPAQKNLEVHFKQGADVDACINEIVTISSDSQPHKFGLPGPVTAVGVRIEDPNMAGAIKALSCVESVFDL
jgi:hypothetical protein